ncbi:hypothetical protein AB0C98_43545 [Streptomyces sp. NPDC048558]|uniref:hypothetical protein n=1 Tax=Actinomycetes TaxID=1760 RepID=UPI00343B9C85
MADLGRVGETRVEPGRLFDPDRSSGPPADALDVQFRAPLSFSLFVDELFRAGREADGRACFTLYEQVIDRTVAQLQLMGGYVLDERGSALPARLELTAYGESIVPGFDTVRVHHHLYVGRTGLSLRDGRRLPVDVPRLRRAAGAVDSVCFEAVQELTEGRFGCRWGPPPGGYAFEILDPPVYERIVGQELGLCPSPWGPRTTWEQPSREKLDLLAADAALIARDASSAPTEHL